MQDFKSFGIPSLDICRRLDFDKPTRFYYIMVGENDPVIGFRLSQDETAWQLQDERRQVVSIHDSRNAVKFVRAPQVCEMDMPMKVRVLLESAQESREKNGVRYDSGGKTDREFIANLNKP